MQLFPQRLTLVPYIVWVNSESSGKTVQMLTWALAVNLGDKYHFLMGWLDYNNIKAYQDEKFGQALQPLKLLCKQTVLALVHKSKVPDTNQSMC